VPTLAKRRADLLQLHKFVRDNKDGIMAAINADYGHRSRHETLFSEIYPALDAIKHTLGHLKKWMKPQRRYVDLLNFFGGKNRVIPQPLGLVATSCPGLPIYLSILPGLHLCRQRPWSRCQKTRATWPVF
jgi:coniferyl-aldehyde dehydrogenase